MIAAILSILFIIFILRIYYTKGDDSSSISLYTRIINNTINNRIDHCDYIYINQKYFVDPITKKKLSNESINEILNEFKKFEKDIYLNKQDIPNNIENNGNIGLIIDISFMKIKRNQYQIMVTSKFTDYGVWSDSYNCIYKNRKWDTSIF